MWHKPCRTFHPWCPCIKTRCLFICFMSPCVGMGRDKWTITWYSFTHVNTLQVCMVQKTEKVIHSRTFTQGLNFTRSLFSVLLFIYILPQVTDIFLLMIANVYLYVCIFICCMPTVILLYWLILWFTNRSELTLIKGSINLLFIKVLWKPPCSSLIVLLQACQKTC